MLANIDFTDRYRTNPPSPLEDLKWVLYRQVLQIELDSRINAIRAKRPQQIPMVVV